ncbi:DUF1573 domain-containing protein [Bacteroides sp. AN502(2024)]|uniref:DUF1573 domain-containing protein n=1 Tax=Bacteroides sp. AN502(2024) TaxID=3160599 RepID=UPI00351561E4
MKNRYLLLMVFLLFLFLGACDRKKYDKDTIALLEEWTDKTIIIPDSIYFYQYKTDVDFNYDYQKAEYKILNFVDSLGCASCDLRLKEWNIFIKEMINPKVDIVPLFVFSPQNVDRMKEIIPLVKRSALFFPIIVDSLNMFDAVNKFPKDNRFHTFLLDENNKVLAIGNPVHNSQVRELYQQLIMGTSLNTVKEQLQTEIDWKQTLMNIGSFAWKESQQGNFVLTNVGNNPLVISNVVTSCNCTKVDYSHSPIFSNESDTLTVIYNAEHPGYFEKTITIYCNAEGSPFKLKIKGEAR